MRCIINKKTISKILILILPVVFFPDIYISHKQLRKTEQELLELVNGERLEKGLLPLEYNENLYRIAMDHNIKMALENKLEHNFPGYLELDERMVDSNIYFRAAGENIAFSNVYPSDFIHNGFVKSPEHYENIVDPKFRQAGIAILETGEGFYITQEFGDIIDNISEEEAEKRISGFIEKSGFFPDEEISNKIKINYGSVLKELSEELLKDSGSYVNNEKLSGFDILMVKSNKLELIEEYIRSSNPEKRYGSYGFAITFGRNREYRGGVFSFVLALRSDLPELSIPLNKMEMEIVNVLNNKLISVTGGYFSYSKKLSDEAGKAVKLYYRGDKSLLSNSIYNILAYQSSDPLKIPDQYLDFFISNKKKSLGVKIFRPEENNIPENYFLLAFVFDK